LQNKSIFKYHSREQKEGYNRNQSQKNKKKLRSYDNIVERELDMESNTYLAGRYKIEGKVTNVETGK